MTLDLGKITDENHCKKCFEELDSCDCDEASERRELLQDIISDWAATLTPPNLHVGLVATNALADLRDKILVNIDDLHEADDYEDDEGDHEEDDDDDLEGDEPEYESEGSSTFSNFMGSMTMIVVCGIIAVTLVQCADIRGKQVGEYNASAASLLRECVKNNPTDIRGCADTVDKLLKEVHY